MKKKTSNSETNSVYSNFAEIFNFAEQGEPGALLAVQGVLPGAQLDALLGAQLGATDGKVGTDETVFHLLLRRQRRFLHRRCSV